MASVLLLHVNNGKLQKLLAENMPVQAVEVIKDRHYTRAVFNTYDWGGFLIWNLREPVSIDGRAALYGDQAITRSRDTWAGGAKWAADPDLRSAGVVIAPDGAALTQLLRTDAHFDLAYEDKVAAVFVARQDGKNGAENNVAELNHTAAPQARPDNIRNRARIGIAPASQDKSQQEVMQNRTARYSGNSLQYCFFKESVIFRALTQDSNQAQLLKATPIQRSSH